ncbi:hypothetical protein, partial [Streptacidiphilus griseoplanus]|uniref:hypothetical protein n=1 Tax=Peterkaempfera griseoplana TaxID=66896 RepID=UPI001C3766EB
MEFRETRRSNSTTRARNCWFSPSSCSTRAARAAFWLVQRRVLLTQKPDETSRSSREVESAADTIRKIARNSLGLSHHQLTDSQWWLSSALIGHSGTSQAGARSRG